MQRHRTRSARSFVSKLFVTTAAVFVYANHCSAGFTLSSAQQFAVLSQFSNNQTNFNNGTITGDIGLGSPRQFTASNGTVTGNIRFSGASNTSGLTPNP